MSLALNMVQDTHTHTLLSKKSLFLCETFHDTLMCLCLFVLCHSAAPEESDNVVQSDETENGTPLNPLVETLSQTALISRLTHTVDTTDFSSPGLIGCRFF